MLFHSLQFVLFFPLVFLLNLYLVNVAKRREARKWLLLAASFVFYVSWSFPLVSLLLFCILLNYYCGVGVSRPTGRRRLWLWSSVVANVGILATFKYLDFGVQSAAAFARGMGLQVNPGTFDLILPLGISFFTFQAMGYVIDVYRRKYAGYDSFTDFALFIAFFPQLIAGPIVRADFFLKSLRVSENPIRLRQLNSGLFLFTVGVFKKAVLADNSANIANLVFGEVDTVSSLMIVLGVLAFASQIYFDFSGYTDMARGLGRTLGIELPENFRRPYVAVNIRDFWQRWHISLSTWLRDYLYISLGGSRLSRGKTYRNLLVTMLLGGLWHGASWTFVIWGAIHGTLLALEHYLQRTRWARVMEGGSGLAALGWRVWTFAFVCVAWIFFRAETLDIALAMVAKLGDLPGYLRFEDVRLFKAQNWLAGLLVPYGYIYLAERHGLEDFGTLAPLPRAAVYVTYLYLIFLVSGATNEFIYFQF